MLLALLVGVPVYLCVVGMFRVDRLARVKAEMRRSFWLVSRERIRPQNPVAVACRTSPG